MNRFYRYLLGCAFMVPGLLTAQATTDQKPTLIISTDFGQDPDDQQSMIRLLHYVNDVNLVGIIANADGNYDHEPPEIRTDLLFEVIDAYGKIYPHLIRVDNGYPPANELKKLVKSGCSGNGRDIPVEAYVGKGKTTEGSQWIVDQVDLATKPVHIAVWGGACDLAQALFDVLSTRSPEEVRKFVKKLRVYFIGKQDSSNQWIMDRFPDLWLILGMSHDGNSWNSSYRGIFLGGDMQITSLEWLHQNVISQHPLGALYPKKTWTMGGTQNPHGAMKEGDTPSFLFFLNNGLNIPEHPEWGGWGGRFQKVDRNLYQDAEDTFYDTSVEAPVTQAKATVFRWRPDIQGDLAARVQWGRGNTKTINHYPRIRIKEDDSKHPLSLTVKSGSSLTLDASHSYDPDGDKLSYEWILYPEAGSFLPTENIQTSGFQESKITLSLPSEGYGTLHYILRVSDQAPFPLVSYKRVIIQVEEEVPLVIFDTDMGSDCDDVGALAILHEYVNQGRARLLGCIYSSGKVPFGAGIIDAINTYFGRPDIPIGADQEEAFGDPEDKMDAGKLARDTAAFGHDIVSNSDVPDQTQVTRQLLVAQDDSSITYITVGHTKALYELLQSEPDSLSPLTGMELAQQKIKRWVALGGLSANKSQAYGSKDWNFFRNGTQAYTDFLLENFPRPVYLINAGRDVLTGQSLVHSDKGSIVRTAYRDWLWKVEKKTLTDGRPSWDLAAVCFAVEGQGSFFETPERGTLHFDVEEGSIWEKQKKGKHFYVNQKHGVSLSFSKYLNSLLP